MLDRLLRVFWLCFQEIGGEGNRDIRFYLYERPIEVSRETCFPEFVCAIICSGIGRKSASTFLKRATDCGFAWDFREFSSWTDDEWNKFLGRLYPCGVSDRGARKWSAIRRIARLFNRFPDEDGFRLELFGGKVKSAELDHADIRRLASKGLPWIRRANAQFIVRNMGGEAIKCDRWISELLAYFGITLMELERALVEADIPLGLFDMAIWAYCEAFVRKVANFAPHFDRRLEGGSCSESVN